MMNAFDLPPEWFSPPSEFSLAPFWFLNDDLDEDELLRQLSEFQAHGVDAFVIHPRVGLPRHLGWMSVALLEKIRFIIEAASQCGMWVMLYDEGMYPSGSASGQVVAENPQYQCRGYVRINLDEVLPNTVEQGICIDANNRMNLQPEQTLISEGYYNGIRYAIVQRPIDAVIRGLHFVDHHATQSDPPEDTPLAIDLLNPEAVQCFIRLVYERYYTFLGEHFGKTIQAIFTDEPHLLGRLNESGIVAGTIDSMKYVNQFLGYDFTPYLPALWDDEAPSFIRTDYERALEHRLEQTYYAQLYNWCEHHHIQLTGHPAQPDAMQSLRYFHIPGQDIVWRVIEPDTASALSGRQSTQAKATSSIMLHTERRRNANEYGGAYGHQFTFDELCWLTNWLWIRGCNLFIPHAFYYSVRGSRYHERPPDVGLHSAWWGESFTVFAQSTKRLSWLNTDSHLVCYVGIIGEHHQLPYRAARICFENQVDFNYLDEVALSQGTYSPHEGFKVGKQIYRVLIVDSPISQEVQVRLDAIANTIPIILWSEDTLNCLIRLRSYLPSHPFSDLQLGGLRVRHVQKAGLNWYLLFNETNTTIDCPIVLPNAQIANLDTAHIEPFNERLFLRGHARCVVITQ